MRKLLLFILVVGQFTFARSMRGNDGGGGIVLSAEFATVGRMAIEILTHGDPSLSLNDISQKIADTKVITASKLCYTEPVYNQEYCQDAHFDRSHNMILFVHSKWDELSCKQKIVLSTHEYLRAAEMETEDYRYSGRFLSGELAQCRKKPGSPKQQVECADLSGTLEYRFSNLCAYIDRMRSGRL